MTTRRGRSRAMGEGELEEGLGRDAYRVLLQWSQQQRLHHKLDRWFGNGKTSAKVAVVDRHDELRRQSRKLVLKLMRCGTRISPRPNMPATVPRHGRQDASPRVTSPNWWTAQSPSGTVDGSPFRASPAATSASSRF